MCLLTLLIPSVSVFMHIGEVKRRTGKLTEWKKAQQAQGGCTVASQAVDGTPEAPAGMPGATAAATGHRAPAIPVQQQHQHQHQQQQQQRVSRLRQLQRRLLDVSVLDDELDATPSSSSSNGFAAGLRPSHSNVPSETLVSGASPLPRSQVPHAAAAGGSAPVPGSKVRRRSFKFWHTDVLTVGTYACRYF
jgi:hypothetical protein